MICAYAISKNEEHNVPRFIEQTKIFDHVVVLDTGSEDNTIQLLRDAGIEVHVKQYKHFDFSEARTDALNLVPEQYQWVMTLDFNEQLEITQQQIDHIVSSDFEGFKIDCYDSVNEHYYENKLKIHKRDAYRWVFAVHEFLEPVNDDIRLGFIDVKIIKEKTRSYDRERFYTMICEREHLAHPHEPHYCWWAISFYKEQDIYYRMAYFCEQFLANTIANTNEFRVYAWIDLSWYHNKEKDNKPLSVDMAIHALSESIIFRARAPHCFARALQHLETLGIRLVVE